MAKRNVIPVETPSGRSHISVRGDAKAVITEFANRLGMKEIALVSRIYTWFGEQPDLVQKGVLGLLPDGYEFSVTFRPKK